MDTPLKSGEMIHDENEQNHYINFNTIMSLTMDQKIKMTVFKLDLFQYLDISK